MNSRQSLLFALLLAFSLTPTFAWSQVDNPEADARLDAKQMVDRLSQPSRNDRSIIIGAAGASGTGTATTAQEAAVALPIQFDFGSARLTAQSRSLLDVVALALNDPRLLGNTFFVEGHTDAVGGAEPNKALSDRRAKAVRDYLASRGVSPDRMTPVGYGLARLIPGLPPTDARHRRVRIVREL
jgi:outer membrane protein OmpA-like peptidoglycan-associated protein